MRIFSYIGEVTCIDVDFGSLFFYIQLMRVVFTDMNDLWVLEMDIEYFGGVVLYIEVRFEVGELDVYNGMVELNIELSFVGEVIIDFLEDFKYFQDLKFLDGVSDLIEQKDVGDIKFGEC